MYQNTVLSSKPYRTVQLLYTGPHAQYVFEYTVLSSTNTDVLYSGTIHPQRDQGVWRNSSVNKQFGLTTDPNINTAL